MGKLVPSRKHMGKCAVTPIYGYVTENWNAPTTSFQLCSCYLLRTYLIVSISVKQRPLILGNTLGLSDTVPGALVELVCRYLQAGSSRSIYVPCTPVDPCWKHKLYINVIATKYKLFYGCKQHESYINIQYTIH